MDKVLDRLSPHGPETPAGVADARPDTPPDEASPRCPKCEGHNAKRNGRGPDYGQRWVCRDCGRHFTTDLAELAERFPIGHVEYITPVNRTVTIAHRRGKRTLRWERLYRCAFCGEEAWCIEKLPHRPDQEEIDAWLESSRVRDAWRTSKFDYILIPDLRYCPKHADEGKEFDRTITQTFTADLNSMLEAVGQRIRRRDAIAAERE